ncbi:MAG: methane monooxygenase/ammonia monooxygenase subunit B [Pseudonocardia sp.]
MTRRASSHLRSLLRLLTVAVLVGIAGLTGATPAFAHGEDKQPPNLRTRTVHFYDMQFSNANLKVGDLFTMRGNMYISQQWPDGVVNPEVTQLTVVAPGPTVLVKDRKIAGQFISQSMRLERGQSYPFEITVQARRAGNWHLHPMVAVHGAGGLIGPGQEVQIAEDPTGAPFTNEVTLRNGETVDLETYNRNESLVWHLLYLIPALLFMAYWFSKPLMPRLIALVGGERTPDDLVTKRDVKVSVMLSVVVLAITAASMVYSYVKWPDTLPLQVQNVASPQGQVLTGSVSTSLPETRSTYFEATDTLEVALRVRNGGTAPIDLSYLEIGNLVFDANPETQTDGELVADGPLTFAAGEERDIRLRLTGPGFHDDAVIPGSEVTSVIGGLLVFTDPSGARVLSELNMPVFKELAAP